jgi:hypothetical protein
MASSFRHFAMSMPVTHMNCESLHGREIAS